MGKITCLKYKKNCSPCRSFLDPLSLIKVKSVRRFLFLTRPAAEVPPFGKHTAGLYDIPVVGKAQQRQRSGKRCGLHWHAAVLDNVFPFR